MNTIQFSRPLRLGFVCLSSFFFLGLQLSCQSQPKSAGATGLSHQENRFATATPKPVNPVDPDMKIKIPGQRLSKSSGSYTGDRIVARPLTSLGINSEPRFSRNGIHILYVSRGRPTHTNSQIYQLNIAKMTEVRLTYQDGNTGSPSWANDNESFIYSSSTDEIKEEHVVIEKLMSTTFPEKEHKDADRQYPLGTTELYWQNLEGREIERLTSAPGFDGEADLDSKSKRLVFTSTRTGRPSLFLMRLNDNENQAAFITKFSDGSSADRMGKFSPDGKTLAWSRQTNPENPISQIFAAEISTPLSTKALTKMTGSSLHPSWHPNGELIIFSSNAHRGTFNLYSVDRAGTCVKRLTEVEVDQLHPSFSPDGKQILFTGQKETRSQIYLMEFDPPTECLAGAAANSIP